MKIRNIALVLIIVPFTVWAGERASSSRVSVVRQTDTISRIPSLSSLTSKKINSSAVVEQRKTTVTPVKTEEEPKEEEEEPISENCRDVYRACMDDFCLLDETEGGRCACSDNIERSKKLIQEIQDIQSKADDLYTVGVEREKLGAKAKLVFGESEAARRSSALSGIDFASWLNGGDIEEGNLGEDVDIGQSLYDMAAESCATELEKCGIKASMEEKLYSRLIVADCKSFEAYLSGQKLNADSNKRTAEAAVRKARLEMLGTTNKYNRGECLLVYRSCIADKGGCGVNFENCLDADLLARRANACEDVLDQCMAVREDVLQDWSAESVSVLADAAKYADRNQRATCLAKIQNCLEEGCSTSTETACLTNVNVAANICPIITECNAKIPGIQSAINDKLAYLQLKFCENDIDACLKDKCGSDFTKPECVGKSARNIADSMCPQNIFPSCKNMSEDNFEIIMSSAMLHMDYQLLTGCINQFAEKLTEVCGTDMACLPVSDLLNVDDANDTKYGKLDMSEWVDLYSAKGMALKDAVRKSADKAVDRFFDDFEQDMTLSACQDVYGKSSVQVKNRKSLRDSVNTMARMVAYTSAENRAARELASLMDNLKMQAEADTARGYCLKKYKEESRPSDSDLKNYSYIRSVSYEPDLHNCHVCRVQHVCETGGENKWTSAAIQGAGGVSAGASIGTMVNPGLGTAIGAVIGGVGLGALGYMTGNEEEHCQELESCEDINISGASVASIDETENKSLVAKIDAANFEVNNRSNGSGGRSNSGNNTIHVTRYDTPDVIDTVDIDSDLQ